MVVSYLALSGLNYCDTDYPGLAAAAPAPRAVVLHPFRAASFLERLDHIYECNSFRARSRLRMIVNIFGFVFTVFENFRVEVSSERNLFWFGTVKYTNA